MQIHEELADAKAENDALRDDVAAGRRQFCIADRNQSVLTTASGVDNATSPDWQDTAEQDYFTLRGPVATVKTTGRNRSILMSSADRVARLDGQLMPVM